MSAPLPSTSLALVQALVALLRVVLGLMGRHVADLPEGHPERIGFARFAQQIDALEARLLADVARAGAGAPPDERITPRGDAVRQAVTPAPALPAPKQRTVAVRRLAARAPPGSSERDAGWWTGPHLHALIIVK